MTAPATTTDRDHHVATFSRLEKDLQGGGRDWLAPLRRHAIERFAELGFPTTRDEDWKYTSVATIARTPFLPALGYDSSLDATAVAALGIAELTGRRLVFIDGHFAPELSTIPSLPGDARIASLGTLLAESDRPAWLEASLGKIVAADKNAFTALNSAFMLDGACLYVPRGVVVEEPIELLFISTGAGDEPLASHPRNLYVLDATSQAHVVESFAHLGGDRGYLSNVVSEALIGAGASFEHTKVQNESTTGSHVATLAARQERDSRLTSRSYAFGAALCRYDIDVLQAATGIECNLRGLFLAAGKQHVDHHTSVDHAHPHGQSRELYKGILDDDAVGVFNGKVMVRPDAQKTDAQQSNKNLLLSRSAVIETKPELEIFADDVKCAHGATIGQLDENARFYLLSRGIGPDEARAMLIFAFASELLKGVDYPPLRRRLHELIFARLPGGERLEEDL